jgi:oligopeptide transport system substrate-binding protein
VPARRLPILGLLVLLAAIAAGAVLVGQPDRVHSQGDVRVRVLGSEPLDWDPAAAADASSAAVLAQTYEGLTAFDVDNNVQPALADRWDVSADGRTITFHLRPGITFSDGSPITPDDVIQSWLRLLDPQHPSPLFSLLEEVDGAYAYAIGQAKLEWIGLRADGDNVVVKLRRPASFFVAVTGSPALGVVPPGERTATAGSAPPRVVSGAYIPSLGANGVIRFDANPNYWAGPPPLATIEQLTDLAGGSPVEAFEADQLDYTQISSYDASWIRYDATLGPQLRTEDTLTLTYYGFDTEQAPFGDARVRRAFAQAVDWDRIVSLASGRSAATSMLPPGIPGRDDTDYRPAYDPAGARDLLAQAGYPGGHGLPPVVLETYGAGYETTVAAELKAALGVDVTVEVRDFESYFTRLGAPGGPAFWTMSWIADYPDAHDFLGLLLDTSSSSNYGHFADGNYHLRIAQAAEATDAAERARNYASAQEILREQVPVIPVDYGEGWALSRDGLLGARPSGVGVIRFAGLDWAPGSGH